MPALHLLRDLPQPRFPVHPRADGAISPDGEEIVFADLDLLPEPHDPHDPPADCRPLRTCPRAGRYIVCGG